MSKSAMHRQQTFSKPAVAANTGVLAAQTLPTSGTLVVTAGITNPDVPRTVRLKGNQSTTQGLVVTVVGTDIYGNALTEAVTMGGAFATPTDSVNAFKTVTSVTFPTRGGASDTISVGLGAALGLDSLCDAFSFLNTPTALITAKTVDTAVISKNTVTLAATLDGSTDQAVEYLPQTHPTGRLWG